MVCLGFKTGSAGWRAQTNPLGFGACQRFSETFYQLNSARKTVDKFVNEDIRTSQIFTITR